MCCGRSDVPEALVTHIVADIGQFRLFDKAGAVRVVPIEHPFGQLVSLSPPSAVVSNSENVPYVWKPVWNSSLRMIPSPSTSQASKLAASSAGSAALFERLLSLRNDVGLLAEEYDPRGKRQLGNFPQAFSHVGLVNAAHNLIATQGPAEERANRTDRPACDRKDIDHLRKPFRPGHPAR